ncbi:MAG: hypothetical protein IT559_06480 [Alphaproteobacteria bacterium]|nr:hypothetical protein [Alphaproteobacteria bacterium]
MNLIADITGAFREEKQEKAEEAARQARYNEQFNDHSRLFIYLSELKKSENPTEKSKIFHCDAPVKAKAFYDHLAVSSMSGTEEKIILSPVALKALTMSDVEFHRRWKPVASKTIKVMATKDFRLSLLFRNSAEMGSPDGQTLLQLLDEHAGQNPAFASNLGVRIMTEDDVAFLRKKNVDGFSTARNAVLDAYRFEGGGSGAIGSLNRPAVAANLSNQFDILFERAEPVKIKLDHLDM